MQTTNVREAREKLSNLLDDVAAGEEIVIFCDGKSAARLTDALPKKIQFPNRSELRASLPPSQESSAQTVRKSRDEECC